MKTLLMSLGFLLAAAPALALDESQFPEGSLVDFERSDEVKTARSQKTDLSFDTDTHGMTVTVSYTGKERNIPAGKKDFIEKIAKVLSQPALPPLYKKEILVEEGHLKFWVPVQESFHVFMPKEMKPGARFKAWVRFMGLIKKESVYLMMGYTAPPAKR